MSTNALSAEREHLANLLEVAQRCAHFLYASSSKVDWPLKGAALKRRQKDEALFEALAAFNERFAKLQDTLGAAMRHSALLLVCRQSLSVKPATADFETEFVHACAVFNSPAQIQNLTGNQPQ